MINLFKHNIGPEEISNCLETLMGGWHTSGPVNRKVESIINNYFSAHSVLTNSCTTGLIALTQALGIGPDDEVITTPMTFSATAASVMNCGAKPVFVDINPNTGLMDLDLIEAAITSNTKAVYVVHLYGHMPNMKKLKKICDKNRLLLVEDCAHAYESHYLDYKPSNLSDAAVFSFYATKNVHCGEGGAVVSKNLKIIEDIKLIIKHGLSQYPKPGDFGNMGYDIVRLGFKGNLSDINASLLPNQLRNCSLYRADKEKIAQQYCKAFKKLKNISPIMPESGSVSAWYTFPLLVENRDSLCEALRKAEIGHTIMYETLENFTLYGNHITCPKASEFSKKQLSIPCYSKLTQWEVKYIIKTIVDWDSHV